MPRKPHNYHYLYKTTNLLNNKFYVGMHSTSNLEDGYLGSGTFLRRSIRKYGKDNFKFEILQFFETREILIEQEKDLVNNDFIKNQLCMNLRPGGTGVDQFTNLGSLRSEETKKKMSENNKGDKNPFYNKTHTDESKKKITESGIGRGKGKQRTEETKQKISNTLKGKIILTEERKKEMSNNLRKKILCIHCSRLLDSGNYAQYHGEKCKLNILIR